MSLVGAATEWLRGVSIYRPPVPQSSSPDTFIDSPSVERMRYALGGQLQNVPWVRTRWYLADLENAEHNADGGNLRRAGELMSFARRDGVLSGVLSTRTSGLVRLPRKFRGDREAIETLELGHDSVRSIYDEMLPPAELALLAADGILLGIGVAELCPVRGRDYPVLVRLDPQYLQYVWTEDTYYYLAIEGRIPITPGDGRWVLHTPGGRLAPWQHGLWRCVGANVIRKSHANMHKDNWEAKLANPARVAVAPQGGTEPQKEGWFQSVMAWGINTVFGLTPGYDVKLLESNGVGAESFARTITACDNELIIAIAGQTVTTSGGAGFANSDIHRTIRADLIKETADSLAYTVNTQCLPGFIAKRYGLDAVVSRPVVVEYDVTPPKDRNAEAQSLVTAANAIAQLQVALQPTGRVLDVQILCEQFGIPLESNAMGEVVPIRPASNDQGAAA